MRWLSGAQLVNEGKLKSRKKQLLFPAQYYENGSSDEKGFHAFLQKRIRIESLLQEGARKEDQEGEIVL